MKTKYIIAGVLLLFPVFLTPLLFNLSITNMYSLHWGYYPIHGIFNLLATISFGLIVWLFHRTQAAKKGGLYPLIIWALISIIALIFMTYVGETHFEDTTRRDFASFSQAAFSVIGGKNPYDINAEFRYFYPPPLAQVMAKVINYTPSGLLKAMMFTLDSTGGSSPRVGDVGLLYYFDCVQYLCISLSFLLIYLIFREFKLERSTASIASALVLLVNEPLLNNLWFRQITLMVVFLCLLSFSSRERSAFISGLALAMGTFLKIYPIILCLPFLITARFKVIIWFILSSLAILLLSTDFGQNITLWQLFLSFLKHPTVPDVAYGVDDLIKGILTLFNVQYLSSIISLVVKSGIVIWFIYRIVRHEKNYRIAKSEQINNYSDKIRFWGITSDACVLIVFLSPMVWFHTFLFVVPTIIWALITQFSRMPWKIGIAVFLILLTTPFYHSSYAKLVGLAMLFYYTRPTEEPFSISGMNKFALTFER
jgi:hypothetical protein